jgi:hypothetical protein
MKTEPSAKSNSPAICQYTFAEDAELISVTVDALAAKAPPIRIINKAFGSPCPFNVKFPFKVEAAPVL